MSKYYHRTPEELKALIGKVTTEFPMYYRKISEISVNIKLKPEETIAIAEKFQRENELEGTVEKDLSKLLFDGSYTYEGSENQRTHGQAVH